MKIDQDRLEFHGLSLGSIEEGRQNLGMDMPVYVYRLMQYALKEALIDAVGTQEADVLFRNAGLKAGLAFAQDHLDRTVDIHSFIADLQKVFKEFRMGIIRLEKLDLNKLEFILTIGEDIGCSGFPVLGKVVCVYDEGFIAGVLEAYTNKLFHVREIDCWASGDRVCRFIAKSQ